jgi:hypothetical protein
MEKPSDCENGERIVFSFPVLWRGWECDSDAWIVERPDGSRYLRMTNHGSRCDNCDPSQLRERLAEYARVAALTKQALAMLGAA